MFSMIDRAGRQLAGAFALLALVGCADIRLTEPYNAEIEQGVNDYHKGLATFVKSMELEAGKPKGRYGSEEVRTYYSESEGLLANLVVKAEAEAPGGNCATSHLASKAVDSFVNKTAEQLAQIGSEAADVAAEMKSDTSVLQEGSCTVVVLKTLRLNHEILESLHRENEYLVPPLSTIALRNMEDGIRIALINENAKK